jgi:hypothetical protein
MKYGTRNAPPPCLYARYWKIVQTYIPRGVVIVSSPERIGRELPCKPPRTYANIVWDAVHTQGRAKRVQ